MAQQQMVTNESASLRVPSVAGAMDAVLGSRRRAAGDCGKEEDGEAAQLCTAPVGAESGAQHPRPFFVFSGFDIRIQVCLPLLALQI